MKLHGAIFDLDGTLLNSMGTWSKLSEDFIRVRGFEASEVFLESLVPLALRQAAEALIAEYGLSESVDEIVADFMTKVGDYFGRVFELKPGAAEFVRELRERGIPCCVATAAERIHTEAALKRLKLIDAFEFILTTEEVGKSKLHADIFLNAAARLGLPADECVVFEDSLYAMRTAKAAGFGVVAIHEPATFGNLDEIRAVSDRFIASFADAPGLFF